MSAVTQGRDHTGDLSLSADLVIIGSGAGGAVVAAEAAAAGLNVVVLEEGPHITAERHGEMRPSESLRHLWRDGGMGFALPLGDSPLINVTMGRCVGGSSMLTGGVCFRTPEEVLAEWSNDMGLADLSARGLDPFYTEVEGRVHVEPVPEVMRSESTRLYGLGLAARGKSLKPLRRNTHDCVGHGQCNFGCPKQAKRSVDLSFLPRAFEHGARVISDCRVDRIIMNGDTATAVVGRLLSPDGRAAGRVRLAAKRVVVSCGAWHSPLLLKRSGLGRASPALGKHLTLHPSFRSLARFDQPVRGWEGALQSAFCDAFMREGITLVSLFVPVGVLAATMPGFGPRHHRRAAAMPHIAMFGGLIHDLAGGVVRRGIGREPFVTYRMAKRDRALIPRLMRLMAEIWFDAGAKEVFLPILGLEPVTADSLRSLDLTQVKAPRIECASQHPLGSCRMALSAQHGVVDMSGRVHGTQNLYVADGSVIPTSLGVNPQLTIMAMALRIARGLLS